MKICLLLYGRIKYFKEHHSNLMSTISNFVYNSENQTNIDIFYSSDNEPILELNEFIKLYNPKLYCNDLIVNTCDWKKYSGLRDETKIDNMYKHFFNKKRVFNLALNYSIDNHFKYDLFILTRLDIKYDTNIQLSVNNIVDDSIYIPSGYDYLNNAINNQIAIGKMTAVKKYTSLFDNVDYLLNHKLSIPHPESLNYANILFNCLQIVRFDLKYTIIR